MGSLRRLVLVTQGGRLRPLWASAYEVSARAVAAALVAGVPSAAAHARGSLGRGRAVYGASDIDLAIVVRREQDRGRVLGRWRRLQRLPGLAVLIGPPRVHTERELELASRRSALTLGLDRTLPGSVGSPGAALYGRQVSEEAPRLLERPGLTGPTEGWRRLAGPARPLPPTARNRQERRIAAWLELQHLWRSAFRYCAHPEWPSGATMPAKLLADSSRILLWVSEGVTPATRRDALAAGAAAWPGEAEWLAEAARWLERPEPDGVRRLPDAVKASLGLAGRIAERLAEEVEQAGVTEVELRGGAELALPHGGWHEREPPGIDSGCLLPLVDWRGLVRPALPDEAAVEVVGEAADAALLGSLGRAALKGPQPVLRSRGLFLLPAAPWWRGALRAIQCELTDPATAALLEGRTVARFPNQRGWSVSDLAARAVAEHAARLRPPGPRPQHSGTALGAAITAARAALLFESARAGEPILPLTAADTMRLAAEQPGLRATAEAAAAAYEEFARSWRAPPAEEVEAITEAVIGLDAYSSAAS